MPGWFCLNEHIYRLAYQPWQDVYKKSGSKRSNNSSLSCSNDTQIKECQRQPYRRQNADNIERYLQVSEPWPGRIRQCLYKGLSGIHYDISQN